MISNCIIGKQDRAYCKAEVRGTYLRSKFFLASQFESRALCNVCLILRSGKLIKNLQIKLLRILSGHISQGDYKGRLNENKYEKWDVFILRWLSTIWTAKENSRDLDSVMEGYAQNIGCASVTCLCFLRSC